MQEVWPEGFHYYWSGYCLIRSAAGQQQDSHSCYTAQPFREDLSSQGSLSSAACTAQAGMELRIGRAPLLLQYNHCNGLKFAILAALFQAAEGMGDYPYTWYAQMKGCSKPLNLCFAKRKQNLCLQHLVVLPLLGIAQLCFLVKNHHQPPRMAACTGSGHGTKASKLGHIPSSNYNRERK